MVAERKISYKAPPTIITDSLISQGARRSKALEEQKRRRAQRVDSARHLDLFADLSLGPSDDEEAEIVREGVAHFVPQIVSPHQRETSPSTPDLPSKNNKKKLKRRKRAKTEKPNKWADRCMYAELLEMKDDDVWPIHDGVVDGLPEDLESGWVAVAPVPLGKRCLAVTHQSSGIVGVVPNTSLRSRVLGKSLLPPFPSNLPPQTALDCILDPKWRDNGILHVLDVIQWKGQDVGNCETPFRFWWRDTRLSELPRSLPPLSPTAPSLMECPLASTSTQSPHPIVPHDSYHFPYPTSFLPIPYHTNMALPFISSHIIPLARSLRHVSVDVPITLAPEGLASTMDVDNSLPSPPILTALSVELEADGLLLYVSQASYEPGTSPLSSWIPIGYRGGTSCAGSRRPLDLFERLVKRRIASGQTTQTTEADMDMQT